MKPMRMETGRTDVSRDGRQTKCLNSSLIGYSRYMLRKGDLFLYREHYQEGLKGYRLARCHGRVKGRMDFTYKILAQAADHTMQYCYERWVDAEDVIQIVPEANCDLNTMGFFDAQLNKW